MTSLGLGGCLADDMGLGKTVTLIALHLKRARREPTLVVCPASLLGNWQREITRFAPGVPVRRFHGPDRTLDDLDRGFVLTTYGTMRSAAPTLAEQRWGMVVADEAQHVKNPHSATAKALRTIPAPARVALTGTPVENNLSELWALLDWTTPDSSAPSSRSAPGTRARWRPARTSRPSSGWPAWSAPSCCAARSPTRASSPSFRPRRRRTTWCRSPANRPRCTRRWCASR